MNDRGLLIYYIYIAARVLQAVESHDLINYCSIIPFSCTSTQFADSSVDNYDV